MNDTVILKGEKKGKGGLFVFIVGYIFFYFLKISWLHLDSDLVNFVLHIISQFLTWKKAKTVNHILIVVHQNRGHSAYLAVYCQSSAFWNE